MALIASFAGGQGRPPTIFTTAGGCAKFIKAAVHEPLAHLLLHRRDACATRQPVLRAAVRYPQGI